MAINKNFVVKNGLEVNSDLIFADADNRRVGVLVTQPIHDFHVSGGVGVTDLVVTGVSTFAGITTFTNNVYVAGISTIDGGVSTGVTALTIIGDLRVTGDISLDDLTFDDANLQDLYVSGVGTINTLYSSGGNLVAGFATVSTLTVNNRLSNNGDLIVSGGASFSGITTINNLAAGVATEFYAATGIQSGGVVIGTGVTTINFTGVGATLVEVDGTTANVFISGGPGISSVGIQSGGVFVGYGTAINFYGVGIASVNVDSNRVAHINVGVTSLGYRTQTYNVTSPVSSPTTVFPFTGGYNVNAVEVYFNGSKLINGSDFTATDGSTVTLSFGAINGDVVELLTYQAPVGNLQGGYSVRRNYVAGPGQTAFTFTGGYLIGDLDVYLNGSKLLLNNDFTANDGLTFNLVDAAREGDLIEAVAIQKPFVGAAGSYVQLLDKGTQIGLANNLDFGVGLAVTGYNAITGVATIGLAVTSADFIPYDRGVGLAVTYTIGDRLDSIISVKDYGATGDGTTDDSIAIQNADSAALAAGKSLFFPSGTYAVDLSTLGSSLEMNVSWIGEDKSRTIIKRKDFYWTKADSKPAYIVYTFRKKNLVLENITFDGQVTTAAAAALNPPVPNKDLAEPGARTPADTVSEDQWSQTYGVNFTQCRDVKVQNCEFKNFLRAGLRFRGGGIKLPTSSGTYSSTASSTISITTSTAHGFSTGDVVYAVFTSGVGVGSYLSPNPTNTYYTVTVTGATTLEITNKGNPASITASGNIELYPYELDEDITMSNDRHSVNNKALNCEVKRTRGYYGDSYYFSAVENLFVDNCLAYDFTRIGYVFEFSQDYGKRGPCRNVLVSNCLADFGHDSISPENNHGFWVEIGSQMKFDNCGVSNCAGGWLLSTNKYYTTGFDGPADSISLTNSFTRNTRQPIEIGSIDRSITYYIDNCQFESNEYACPYSYISRGYPGNCVIRYYHADNATDKDRFVVNITNTDLKQVGWSSSPYYGAIFVSHGESTSDSNVDRNTLNLSNITTEWLDKDFEQNRVGVITTFEQGGGSSNPSLRYSHWGDISINGSPYTDSIRGGTSAFIGKVFASNIKNITTGFVMVSLESRSQQTEFHFDSTRMSVKRGTHPGSGFPGNLYVHNSTLFDMRGTEMARNILNISNSTIADATVSNPSRDAILYTDNIYIKDCRITKPLKFGFAGNASSSIRPLIGVFENNHFYIDLISEGYMLEISQGFPLYSTVLLNNNVFQHVRTGSSMAGTEKIISLPINPLSKIYMIGQGNVFDDASPHVCLKDSSPAYNDSPTTAAYPWTVVPIGYESYFEGA